MRQSCTEWISPEECLHGHLYHIIARNGSYGIYDKETKCFDLSRHKWGSNFIFPENHWDTCTSHGTAKPIKMIGKAPEFTNDQEKLDYLQLYEKADHIEYRGAIFVDIDGTLISWETGEPLVNAVETVNQWRNLGYQIIITTRRGNHWPYDSPYTEERTIELLERIGVTYDSIVWNVFSPRLIINDEGGSGITHPKNADWTYDKDEPFNPDYLPHQPHEQYGIIASTVDLGEPQHFWFYTIDEGDIHNAMNLQGFSKEEYELGYFRVVRVGGPEKNGNERWFRYRCEKSEVDRHIEYISRLNSQDNSV